jgi:hypothetical protein
MLTIKFRAFSHATSRPSVLCEQDIVEQLLAEPRVPVAAIEQLLEHVQRAVAGGDLDDDDLTCLFQPDMVELLLGPTAIDLRLGAQLLCTLRSTPALLEAAYSLVTLNLRDMRCGCSVVCNKSEIHLLRCACRSHV